MPNYMTQTMSSPNTTTKLYYRRQTQDHPTHTESGQFTEYARTNYASFNNIAPNLVASGTYRSGQGVPDTPNSYEI